MFKNEEQLCCYYQLDWCRCFAQYEPGAQPEALYPEFEEFENYEQACRRAEEALAERYPENVYRRQDLRDYKDIYCFILREQTGAEGGQRNAG